MRRANKIFIGVALAAAFAGWVGAQQNAPAAKAQAERVQPLVLTETIPLEGIKGRFDHFGFGGGRIFVAALGSNAVEAINVGARTLDHSITGVPDPQGVVYSPETKKLFVGSGSAGKVYIYNAATYDLITTVDFEGGADQLLAKVPTAIGAATAGYWGKQGKGFDRFYLAVPARGTEPAEVRIYVVQD